MTEYKFADGATVRLRYRVLKRQSLDWPDQAIILNREGNRYKVRHEKTGQEFTVAADEVFGVCGCAWPGHNGACLAHIHHGPGHQSHTHCRIKGEHEVHEAVYGSMRQFAEWTGDEVFSGFFDEPPE